MTRELITNHEALLTLQWTREPLTLGRARQLVAGRVEASTTAEHDAKPTTELPVIELWQT